MSNPSSRHAEAHPLARPLRNCARAPVDPLHEFQIRPLQITWEMTQACAPKARRKRPRSNAPHDRQLSTAEAFHLIDQAADMHVPLLVLSGGNPLVRPDLFPLLEYSCRRSVRTSLTLLASPELTRDLIFELKGTGLMRIGLWLEGSTPALHDAARGATSPCRRTLEAIGWCNEAGLPVQINTTIARRNFHDVDPMIELLVRLDVALWSVFFFVPAVREQAGNLLSAEEHERVFARLYAASKRVHFTIKTNEGQHYQRYLLEQRARESHTRISESEILARAPKNVDDGKGLIFVNHAGEVYPSRFLPLSSGNVTRTPLREIYASSPLFLSLRDRSQLKGKCRRCMFRNVCGGSRARAYACTGDPLAEEPCCAYQP